MTNYIILALCIIVVLSYLFDISSSYSRIPGVMLLIGLGILLQLITESTGFSIPNMQPVLPVIGTLGLILIVMDASLDLKLEKRKAALLQKSVLSALTLLIVVVAVSSVILVRLFDYSGTAAVLNSIPLGIISSAVAIPSARHLKSREKEFIIYESSFSDIFGILAFDFIIFNRGDLSGGIPHYLLLALITVIVAVVVSSGLAMLLHKIKYHINYIIIMTVMVLVYSLAKMYHLPALLLVLAFGLTLSNSELGEKTPINRYVDFDKFRKDIDAFKKVVGEFTFLVRSFFFIIFGYYTSLEGIFYPRNLLIALSVTAGIILIRWLFLWFVLKEKSPTLVLFAPRGLITILLFISIPSAFFIPEVNTEVITLVILMTMLTMMLGNIIAPKKKKPHDLPETKLPEVIKTEPPGIVQDISPETRQD